MTNTENKTFYTTYREAVDWLNNNYILCNKLPEIDQSVFENMRFDIFDEENDSYTEIYQWYLTDAGESDVEFLEKHFGLLFAYSDLLDCYVLCVDHLGTSWGYVKCEVLTHGEELSPYVKSYEELTGQKI